jgi:hypothetical protein
MYMTIVRRAGALLLAMGVIDGIVTFMSAGVGGWYAAGFEAAAIVAGLLLLHGHPRSAFWLRALAVFLLAAGLTGAVVALLLQPLDLTMLEIRLDPGDFATKAAQPAFALGVLAWVAHELKRRPVLDAIASARLRQWDTRLFARGGIAVAAMAGILLWLALHGQSASLAESLAEQQMGPGYRYHLSWISSSHTDQGTSTNGVVTAWNDHEIKTLLIHWLTR